MENNDQLCTQTSLYHFVRMSNTNIVTAFQQTLRKSFRKTLYCIKIHTLPKLFKLQQKTSKEISSETVLTEQHTSIQLLMIYKAGTKKKERSIPKAKTRFCITFKSCNKVRKSKPALIKKYKRTVVI